MKPNFFILGAPKCGTTAMSRYLREHPNVFLSEPKEPMYFDIDLQPAPKMSRRDYLSLFDKADPARHRAVGEASTSYLFSTEAVAGILDFNPEAKFLVMLRNPVDLVQAFHSQMLFNGAEDIRDFERAWDAEGDRRRGLQIPDTCVEPKFLWYSRWGLLGEQMERFLGQTRRDRVCILWFDDFAQDPRRAYESVLSFLGLPSDGRMDFPKVKENKVARWAWLDRLTRFARARWWRVKERWGIKTSFRIFSRITALNGVAKGRTPLSEEARRKLARFYSGDVAKLSKLLSRDLSAWDLT